MPYWNEMIEIKNYFSTPERPVSITEFMMFWQSLSDSEMFFYRMTPLDY